MNPSNRSVGIRIENCTDVTVTDSKFHNLDSAIEAFNSTDLRFSGNKITMSDAHADLRHLADSISALEIDHELKSDLLAKLSKVESTPSKKGKLERYKSFLELINLHKEVVVPGILLASQHILTALS